MFNSFYWSTSYATLSTFPNNTDVQMWRQNASEKVVTTLNHYGVCQGKKAARGHVDRLGANHDRQFVEWKK